MNDELYIDVVSRTIISRLSEAISQFVGEKLSETLNKLLLTEMPKVISKELTPALSRVQEEMLNSAGESGEQVLEELERELGYSSWRKPVTIRAGKSPESWKAA